MFRVTAMHLAAIENHADIIEVLLQARAHVNPVDEEGDLPIHWAATKGHADVRCGPAGFVHVPRRMVVARALPRGCRGF